MLLVLICPYTESSCVLKQEDSLVWLVSRPDCHTQPPLPHITTIHHHHPPPPPQPTTNTHHHHHSPPTLHTDHNYHHHI
ncbi:hypothetical protein DPMN_002911 [Dreissena polymorpha]|uniref:Uncharacterized protein n=1 Tax=Dreissena polymorpha TaxID=45954 RepID=A0A9D4MMW0_DREPO|nr:hypothetical protein DPMN_002911 [Dreissena polymorpha]